jgi:hypothetical protein
MKKLAVLGVALFILCGVSVAVAGQNISGIWGGDGSGVTNVQVIFAQSGKNVQVAGYFEINGTPYVWSGSGTLIGNALEYSVIYSKNPDPGNGPNGKHVMTLSSDGRTITGQWNNNYGNSGTVRYVKQK